MADKDFSPSDPGTQKPASDLMNQMFPLMGQFAQMMGFDPDRAIINKLTGGNVMFPYGAMSNPINYGNAYQQQNRDRMFAQVSKDITTSIDMYRMQSLTGAYQAMGYDAADAESRAKADKAKGFYTPMGALSFLGTTGFAMFGNYGTSGLDTVQAKSSMRNAGLAFGLQGKELFSAIGQTNQIGQDYLLSRYGMDPGKRADEQVKTYQNFASRFTDVYFGNAKNFSGSTGINSFGTLTYGGASEVMNQMVQRGQIGMDDLQDGSRRPGERALRIQRNGWGAQPSDIGGAQNARADRVIRQVQDMSKAVKSMQELFGGTIPEVLDQLDAVFGKSSNGTALNTRVLQLKHSAQRAGMSVSAAAQMAMVGSQYAQQAGDYRFMGGTAAIGAANLMTPMPGGIHEFTNNEQLRQDQLKLVSGAQSSVQAKNYSGAYMMYLQKNKLTDTAQEQEKFYNAVQKSGGLTLDNLSKVAGASAADIQAAGHSESATKFRRDTQWSNMAASEQYMKRYNTTAGRMVQDILRGRGKNVKMSDIMGEDGVVDAVAITKRLGLGAEDAGAITATLDDLAKSAGYESSYAATDLAKSASRRRENQILSDRAVNVEKEMQRLYSKIPGFAGVLEAFRTGGAGGKETVKSVGDLTRAMLGLNEINLGDMNDEKVFSKVYEDAVGSMAEGKGLDKGEKDVMNRVMKMTMSPDEMANMVKTKEGKDAVTNLFKGMKRKKGETNEAFNKRMRENAYNVFEKMDEGKDFAIARKAGMAEEYLKAQSIDERMKITREASLGAAAKDADLTDAEKKAIEDGSRDSKGEISVQKILETARKNIKDGDKYKKFEETLQSNMKEANNASGEMSLQDVLIKVANALDNLANKTNNPNPPQQSARGE